MRIYSTEGKSVTQTAGGGGLGGKTGLYAIPQEGRSGKIYEVINGKITINDKQYPIKLSDGLYYIMKLHPLDFERLQTLPDGYTEYGIDLDNGEAPYRLSNAQRYKAIGNCWTADVIIHILNNALNNALKNIPRDEEIVVLSMYDGIATGRYCLDKMGFTNVKYYAMEIDKSPMSVAKYRYPDIIELGDAFQVRNEDWRIID